LRLALYQLLFLDKVPDYAAVNEGVEQAKRYGGQKAAALINGVLRKILREKDRLLLPEAKTGLATHLAVLWSHPEWLVKRWLEYFGPTETEALLRANNQAAPLTLRANRLKDTRENLLKAFHEKGLEAEATPWSPQGIRVKGSSGVERVPGFEQGLFQVQGEASQLIGYLLGPKPGERILDACAAPGGKTTHLAELMEDRGEIVATDVSARGLEKLKQNVQRLGLRSIRSYRVDVLGGLDGPLARPYDRVLVDAPCSALGTLRSHPEAKWHRSEADVERLSGYQKRILERLSGYLKPGGTLIYATCTLTREENEDVVENFLDQHSDFALEDAAPHLPGEARGLIKEKFFMALPHKHETEGFFAARMRKGGGKSG
jgi:16S rRNA (cytosine967-C5)-methyltransferase